MTDTHKKKEDWQKLAFTLQCVKQKNFVEHQIAVLFIKDKCSHYN
jgi:hypothetical protein